MIDRTRCKSMTNTRVANDVTNSISLIYFEIKIELLGPIWLGVVCDENQIWQWPDWLNKYDLHRKKN